LEKLIQKYVPDVRPEDKDFYKEFILWALSEFKKLSRHHLGDGLHFKDVYGGYISGLQ
jgi:magnesium chelatase subunit I